MWSSLCVEVGRSDQSRADDWRESVNGPAGGEINFMFMRDGKTLGTLGLTRTGSEQDLGSVGTLMRPIAHGQVSGLLDRLGLAWP